MEEIVLEKLKKRDIFKYEGFPEYVRDFETQSHYYIYIWDAEDCEEEWAYRQTKAMVIDMWFEGKFVMRDHIYLEDLKNIKTYVDKEMEKEKKDACDGNCDECEEECNKGTPPPPENEKERKARTTYIR